MLGNSQPLLSNTVRYGLVVRIAGSHPAGPGSIPGNGITFFHFPNHAHLKVGQKVVCEKILDEDGIRTHAGRAHWISSPTP